MEKNEVYSSIFSASSSTNVPITEETQTEIPDRFKESPIKISDEFEDLFTEEAIIDTPSSINERPNRLKEYLSYGIIGTMGLFSVLMYFFVLLGVSLTFLWTTVSMRVSGYNVLLGRMSVFGYSEKIPVLWVILGWLSFLILLGAFAYAIILNINHWTGKNILKLTDREKGFKRIALATGIISFLYMILGIIFASSFNSDFNGDSYTAAFWPFIIMVVLVGGYIALNKIALPDIGNDKFEQTPALDKNGKPIDSRSATLTERRKKSEVNIGNILKKKPDAVEEIKKYKELLDAGAITQEEYDAKKEELLNS